MATESKCTIDEVKQSKEPTQKHKRYYPEIRERYRITENTNYLRRLGFTVIPPVEAEVSKQ